MNTPTTHIDPELLSAFLDSEVSAGERQLIEAHLPSCAECQQEMESLRFTSALVGAMPLRAVPRPFYVTEAMVTPEAKKSSGGIVGWLRTLAPFGAVAAAILVVFVLTRPTFESGGASTASAPQASEPEIAVLATDANESAEATLPVDSSTRQSDEVPAPETESALVPESPPVETPTEGFSITAPIVGASGADGTTGEITATAPLTAIGESSATSADGDADAQVTPFTFNTALLIAVILLIALGALVLVMRRR